MERYTISAICTRCRCDECKQYPTVIFGLTKPGETLTKDSLKVCAKCIKKNGYKCMKVDVGPFSKLIDEGGKKYVEVTCPNCADGGKPTTHRVEISEDIIQE